MISKRLVFLLVVILLFLGAVYASQKKVDLPIYAGSLHPRNTDKYGTSAFTSILEENGFRIYLGGVDDLDPQLYGLYILLGPDMDIKADEAGRILQYVLNGGKAIIASEFGDIKTILTPLNIYPSRLIDYMKPEWIADPLIKISCLQCNSFNEMYLDLPGSFIIASSTTPNKEIQIQEAGEDYIIFTYHGDISYTAFASGKIVDLNSEFKKEVNEIVAAQGIDMTTLVRENNFIGYIVESGVHPDSVTFFSDYFTIVLISFDGGGKLALISDTSPFINFYVERGTSLPLIKDIIEYLSPENENILFDVNHYEVFELQMTLPHFGRILLEAITNAVKEIEVRYTNFFRDSVLILMGSITLIGFSMFISLRRYLRIRDEAGLAGEDVVERDIIISTESLIPLKDIYGSNFKEFVKNTYGFMTLILQEVYKTSVDEVLRGDIQLDNEIYESVKLIDSIYRRVNRRIIFPPILNKRGVVKRLLRALENISRVGGG